MSIPYLLVAAHYPPKSKNTKAHSPTTPSPHLHLHPLRFPSKKSLHPTLNRRETLLVASIIRRQTRLDPLRQLLLDPLLPIPSIHQQDSRPVPFMPDSAPDRLVDGPHTHVFRKLPACGAAPSGGDGGGAAAAGGGGNVAVIDAFGRFLLNVLHTCFPLRRMRVRVWQADHYDAAAEGVAEIDAFGEFAADDCEEEGAFVGCCGGASHADRGRVGC